MKIFGSILDTKFSNPKIKDQIGLSLRKMKDNEAISKHWQEIISSLS